MKRDQKDMAQVFPATEWGLVVKAAEASVNTKRIALGEVVKAYRPALLYHLVRIRRLQLSTADDILQGFLTEKVLEDDLIRQADRQRGKFRSFLIVSLEHYMANEFRYQNAAKRKAPAVAPLDETIIHDSGVRPEKMFDILWAKEVLARAIDLMRTRCESSKRADLWGVFEGRTVGPALHNCPPISYEEIVQKFSFVSPSQASNALITSNRMFARCLREIVAEYSSDEREIEDEIAELRNCLSLNGAGKAR